MKTAEKRVKKEVVHKSLFVAIFQWLYLTLGVLVLSSPLWVKTLPIVKELSLPLTIVTLLAIGLSFYCLLLSLSFFTQNSTLLIFALVFIFFTTIAILFLLGFSVFNVKSALHGLPECVHVLKNCGAKEVLVIFSFLGFVTSVPLLLLNILTIVATVKAIAARA